MVFFPCVAGTRQAKQSVKLEGRQDGGAKRRNIQAIEAAAESLCQGSIDRYM